MNRYLLPFKREFWEYRGSFIRLPVIGAIVISLLMTIALAVYASNVFKLVFDQDDFHITTNEGFLNGKVHVDLDFNESSHHRDALITARADLMEARNDLLNNSAEFDRQEVQRQVNSAQEEIAKAEEQLQKMGIKIDLDKALSSVSEAKIKAEIQHELDKEIAKLDKEISQLDAALEGSPHVAPAAPVPPVAPKAPVEPSINDELRQFPSQVIVIEGDKAVGFTDDNIESIDGVIKVFFVLFSGLMMIVGLFYLLSCLYTDRKDNSILFWKSMPVSETQNVLTKIATGIFLLPSIAVLSGLAVGMVFTLLSMIYVANYSSSTTAWELWSGVSLFSFAVKHWVTALGVALWCLPSFAWLTFASAAARRSPFMLALLPPAVLAIAEEIIFNSNWVLAMIISRLPGVAIEDNGNSGFIMFEQAGLNNFSSFVTSPGLWLGLIVAASLLYATIWVRNNRYEI